MQAVADTFLIGDVSIRRLGFGAMRLTGPGTWGEPSDRSEAKRVLRRAIKLGVNLIDTADAYGPGVSERLIAQALHPYPENLVIATKGGRTRQGPYRWGTDCRPANLREACEASLRRLRLERIDLYQLHTVDPQVRLEDSVGALAELQAEGKVRHIGLCNVDGKQLSRARSAATIVSVQNSYSLADISRRTSGERPSPDQQRADTLDSYRLAGVHTLRRQLRRWARPLAVPIAARILLLRFPRR